jgi:hypothetical protein
MALIRITYWRDIPVLVTAREGADEATVPLGPAFQDLVDRVALEQGVSESEAYLAEWRVGPEETRPGAPAAVARAVAAEIEADLETLRVRYLPPRAGPA